MKDPQAPPFRELPHEKISACVIKQTFRGSFDFSSLLPCSGLMGLLLGSWGLKKKKKMRENEGEVRGRDVVLDQH